MPCGYSFPAKGHQRAKKCNAPESAGGFCAAHQPKPVVVAVTPVTLTWFPRPAVGTTVNAKFQTECDENATMIANQCQNGIQGGGMPLKGKGGSHSLLHYTQPRANNTFFYRWVGNTMEVYGVGNHTGGTNKIYSLTWFDGSSATVDLGKKTIV